MPAKTTTLADLAAEAERVRQEYQAAADAAEAAAAKAEQRRTEALAQHDRARLDAYDDEALAADVRAAEQKLRAAILADPVYRALIDLHAAGIRRSYRHSEASGDVSRLGIERTLPMVGAPAQPSFELVLRTIASEASAQAADEQDERDAARIAAGDKAAGS